MTDFLRIGEKTFEGELCPSDIKESVDILKNTERALDGTLYVDFTNRKKALEIYWCYLSKDNLKKVLDAFAVDKVLEVDYYNNTEEAKNKFYVDEISYIPKYINEELVYTDIVISLLEV